MTQERRKRITGGVFQQQPPPERDDLEDVTRQIHQQRGVLELARLDKPEFVTGRPMRIGRAVATRTGLALPDDLSSDEFREIGTQIFTLQGVTQWWIGDYLLYRRGDWGDLTEKIALYFGREPQTLYNILSVARKFETSRRREILTFAHHEIVAGRPLELQEKYLEAAAATNPPMTVKALRELMRQHEGTASPTLPHPMEQYRKMRGEAEKLLNKKGPLTAKQKARFGALLGSLANQIDREIQWLEEAKRKAGL
jgi:hypothetical protein